MILMAKNTNYGLYLFSTTTTEDGSTAGTAEENWLQLELEMLERMSVRTQTLEEIMAEVFHLLLLLYK